MSTWKGCNEMDFIRNLHEINQKDSASAGGKGANLGALMQAGFPVPSGFVLLTSAYRQFVWKNALQEVIEQLATSVTLDDLNSIASASSSIRAFFENGQMPDEIANAIKDAYTHLGNGPVAIRSSATAEDLPDASFAGQQETYLHVQSEHDVLTAIRRCWSSLWTARALAYRLRHAIAPSTLCLAVVVQQMVQADSAGVLFTVNPVTGKHDEMVMNATWGLGEALVEGSVTPDMVVVDKRTNAVRQQVLGSKTVMVVPTAYGTEEQEVDALQQQKLVLTDRQVELLTQLGNRIETYFGAPQDIEWAIENEHVFILQARPITTKMTEKQTVPPGDDSWDMGNDATPQVFDVWTRTNIGENIPLPVTPLTLTNFPRLFGLDTQMSQGLRRFYGRIYINEGAIIHGLTQQYGLPSNFIDKMWGSRSGRTQQKRYGFRPLRLLRTLPTVFYQRIHAPKQSKHTPQEFFAQVEQWVTTFMAQDLSLLSDSELWATGLPVWSERGKYVFNTNIRISIPSALFYAILERLTQWWTRQNLAQDAVTGLPGIYSAEVGPQLWHMVHMLRSLHLDNVLLDNDAVTALTLLRENVMAMPCMQLFEDFLQRHGHRCPNEVELLNPRWVEAPEQVLELLTSYLQAGESINPTEAEKRQRQRREEAVTTIVAQLDPIRKVVFLFMLKKAQQAIVIRDNSRFYVTKFLFPIRKVYAHFGQRWAERGWLRRYDDIFFLTTSEIQALAEHGPASVQEVQTRIANRRTAYEYWLTIIAPDALGPDGTPLVDAEQAQHMLSGVPASSGRAHGRARIIQNVQDVSRLTSEDILVTQATDPGWTPIFPLVKGIVLEVGGQLSHGAIVAREYGVPAVVNVQGALHRIQDGQFITVDGTQGHVYLQNEKGYNS